MSANHDQVYVISDLHMGGAAGCQILRETGRLAAFIRWVAGQRPDGRVALVLNGDTVDTLAEKTDGNGYVAFNDAVKLLTRIMADPSFAPVWDALAAFVHTPGRTLVFVLGNHDIELAFPAVQDAVFARLAGDDATARGRITFSTMGCGYACTVGDKRIFCTLGNEVDPWNYIRYEDLSKAGRRLSSGRALTPSDWEPNAGTMLVKDVMNGLKTRHAWIDLLKPEKKAALGILLALDPGQMKKILKIVPVVGELVEGKSEFDGRLSAEGLRSQAGSQPRPVGLDCLLGASMKQRVLKSGNSGAVADDLLRLAEQNYKTFDPEGTSTGEPLGTMKYYWDRVTGGLSGVSKEEALRLALLDWRKGDTSFLVSDQDDTCKNVLNSLGTDIDYIVTGHTHLERFVKLADGRFYFNCGTWIRLLQITEAMLKDEAAFKPVYDVLINGTMQAIDQAEFNNGERFVLNRCGAVCIRCDNGAVTGGLYHIEQASDGSIVAEPV